ncbi:MAG: Peptidyl-tRNA hydrolase [Thermocaproicibacter melissae]|jgi:peptidyl-tRNA hydrolase, PTH1 family|uniref:aminoacyl-tRNA hydrolase n=1 Tax=Thermocaproicibacter melissae TaxID=2966552 RepID=UPI003A0FC4E8
MLNLFHKLAKPSSPVEYIIVGLGNPGPQYEGTHHNAGFMAIDALAEKCGVKIDRLKFKGLCATTTLAGKKVLLLKPTTYMNLSGQSVVEAMQFYKLPPERVIILYDDISFPPGKLRIRMKGSDGGQNGMKNIIYLAGSDAFPRIRLGTGDRPDRKCDLADWVLAKFTESDKKLFDQAVENACAALELMVQGKTAEAMSLYNGKG